MKMRKDYNRKRAIVVSVSSSLNQKHCSSPMSLPIKRWRDGGMEGWRDGCSLK